MGQTESSTLEENSNNESKSDSNNTMKMPRKWYDEQLLKRSGHINFDVEAWYKILQNETFYTEFIPISPSIAQAFVNFYQTRYSSTKVLNSNDIQLIQSIQNQLKEQIFNSKTNPFHNSGTFIRLSSRSPKDGRALDSQKLSQIYHQELRRLQDKYPNECDSIYGKGNMQFIAYCYAQSHSLKVTNEIQALNIILSSERVFYDLSEVLDCQQVQDDKVADINNIIIREWNDSLDDSMEFRCFVYQSNLTAISQYNHYCKFYHLQNDLIVQQIKLTIMKYWEEKIKPLFDPFTEKYSNYIMDIGVIENKLSNQFECIVIELNPFATSTGTSLFDWTTDINQLTGQGNEVEIRVRSDYYEGIECYIEFILEVTNCNANENVSSDRNNNKEPYFIYLDKIKQQLSSESIFIL
jgi:hypothetical protein